MNSGTVTLSKVEVVNSTTIIAEVTPADTDPEEPAEVILWGHNNNVLVYNIHLDAEPMLQSSQWKPADRM
jgi:hypothetical protein